MTPSTKIGLAFAVVGFLVGFFDRQLFGREPGAVRWIAILGLGLACFATMFALNWRARRRK